MTPTLAQVCKDLEIRVVPNSRHRTRMMGETCAERSMEKILRLHGPGHLTIVLKSIIETRSNGRQLVAPVILAVSDIIKAHPSWAQTTEWLDALDEANLAEMWEIARANRKAAKPRAAIATMLFNRLREILKIDPQGRLV